MAPLKAATASADGAALGAPATVGDTNVNEPRVATLGDGRVLSLWQHGAFDAALSYGAGAFGTTPAPRGRPDPFSDASGNRSLAAAGRYAAVIWGGGGKAGFVRVSVRRF